MHNLSIIDDLANNWAKDPLVAPNIASFHIESARDASLFSFPADLHANLVSILCDQGITHLYSHQLETWDIYKNKGHPVIVTGTASGKTLCYNLPILNHSLKDEQTRALYIFPTKALAADQLENIRKMTTHLREKVILSAEVYNGDTPPDQRGQIRQHVNFLLTNPDMLHMGILPHHTLWAEFFRHLRFIVIDEIHIYRGIFGSHFANIMRRLKRIMRFYGSQPQFLMTSATIANPKELAEKLVEEKVVIVDKDGSPKGTKFIVFYNPPIIKTELGIRRSSVAESVRLAGDLLTYGVQACLFGRSRRTVEIILHSLREQNAQYSNQIHGYRSGYLPKERRSIEKGLRSGEIRLVAATNALELGVDIGTMDAVILVGYPGSVAATRQQFGRAGRRNESSLAIFVASAGPLDQFLMKHPEFIIERSAERGLINPDNLLILLQHLRCAAFELPFKIGETFGTVCTEIMGDLLKALEQMGYVHLTHERYFWMANQYPASDISLRSVSPERVNLQYELDGKTFTIGEVDKPSAAWMVHPNAIYMHEGQSYLVKAYDPENNVAFLIKNDTDYFTEPKQQVIIEKISTDRKRNINNGWLGMGELEVTSQVVGFRRINWQSREILGNEELDLPPTSLRTMGCWLVIGDKAIENLRESGLWTNDQNNYGKNWNLQRQLTRERDHFTCQVCGSKEGEIAHHVHHIIPFRNFENYVEANRLINLITLCPNCHQRAELSIRIRSGLSGLSYAIHQMSSLYLMCDVADLGAVAEPKSVIGEQQPTVILYERIPAGIGLSEELFRSFEGVLNEAYDLVKGCGCNDGCPSCVGPGGENCLGGKRETVALLSQLCDKVSLSEGHGINT